VNHVFNEVIPILSLRLKSTLNRKSKLVMSQLGHDFQVEAKADFKEVPLWVGVKVQPYSEAEEPEESEEIHNDL